MAGRTNRYRRGEKSTDVRVGYLGGKPSLIANWGGRMYGVPLSMDGAGNTTRDSNFGNIRVKGDAVFDSGASVLRIKGDGISIKESNVEVAKFGATTTVKDIVLTGRIDNTDGAGNNVIIGQDNPSVADNTTGTYFKENVIIGSGAGEEVATVGGDTFTLNVAIGYQAMNDIDPDAHSNNATSNVAVGHAAMLNFHYGAGNTAIGKGALLGTDATGSNNIGIGVTAGGNITSGSGNVVIGDSNLSSATGDDQLIIASGGGDVTWLTGADDGTVSGELNDTSDRNRKQNIVSIDDGLSIVKQFRPVTFEWKKDSRKAQGFIAQEIEEVLPDCVSGIAYEEDEDGISNGLGKVINVTGIVANVTKAVQELSAKLDNMDERLTNLEGV